MINQTPFLQIQLKSLAEEMQAIIKGLEKVKQELTASANDGPVSEVFHKVIRYLNAISSEMCILFSFHNHNYKFVKNSLNFTVC